MSGVPYSATTAAILGEVLKIPVLAAAVLTFQGRKQFMPVLRQAFTDKPFSLAFPGFAYSVQNVLYFQALSHVSVATYQILSQSKLLFTGFFMVTILHTKITKRQALALLLLMCGTVFTQLSEMSRNASVGGNALYGGFLTLAGAALSAFPNVYYEKVLKTEGQNQWTNNIQLTFWIWFWLIVISLPSVIRSEFWKGGSGVGMLSGIGGWVWLVLALQSLKCLLIPATLKFGGNILYSYAKPASIILSAFFSAVVLGIIPSVSFLCGAALVLVSLWIYES